MRKRRCVTLLASIAFLTSQASLAASPHTLRVHFVDPESWSCVDVNGCTTCRNISTDGSDVVIEHGDGEPREELEIPSGFRIEVCNDRDAVA